MYTKKIIMLLLIILLGAFLRFYNLGIIPAGVFVDEASHGYNAYSLLLTGKDEWGKSFPVFLRGSGDYPSPLYTYLSIIPILLMDLSVFSTRLVSALSGTLLILLTFLIVNRFRNNSNLAFISALLVAISPWSILFSRAAIEANLALTIVALSFYLLLISLDKPYFFILGAIVMGLSTYAYHAERVVSILYLVFFLLIYKKRSIRVKAWVLSGIIFFFNYPASSIFSS